MGAGFDAVSADDAVDEQIGRETALQADAKATAELIIDEIGLRSRGPDAVDGGAKAAMDV